MNGKKLVLIKSGTFATLCLLVMAVSLLLMGLPNNETRSSLKKQEENEESVNPSFNWPKNFSYEIYSHGIGLGGENLKRDFEEILNAPLGKDTFIFEGEKKIKS